MPIKFRCAFCSQLMAIGRRKIGSVVMCPTCQGQVIVPAGGHTPPSFPSPPRQTSPSPQPSNSPPKPKSNLFEQRDFDAGLFESAAPPVKPKSDPPPKKVEAAPLEDDDDDLSVIVPTLDLQDVEPIAPPAKSNQWLLIVVGFLLTLMGFAAGYVTARLM